MTHPRFFVLSASLQQLEQRDVPATSFTDLPLVADFDPETIANVRRIAYIGDLNGRRDDVFMKVGDSNSHSPEFMQALGQASYNPIVSAMPADLISTWAVYRAPADTQGHNSFSRDSLSDMGSMPTAWMLDHIDDELAVSNAGVALIQAGTTEIGFPGGFERTKANVTAMVDRLMAAGVIPILDTLPWMRYYGNAFDPVTIQFNQMLADLAEEKSIPIVNIWRAMDPLPNNGLKFTNNLGRDFLHLNVSPRDPGGFLPIDLLYAQNIRALLILQTLKTLRSLTFDPSATAPIPTIAPWNPLQSNEAVFAAGTVLGQAPVVTVFDATTGLAKNRLLAFEPSFRGGVNVAVGDVNGDGVRDIVTSPGSSGGPLVRAFSGANGSELFSFFAYEESFRGGVTVAVGDVDSDGANEIVVGSGEGGGPRVRVFRTSDRGILSDFFAYEASFRGGVNVAVGEVGGSPAVIAGSGVGGGPVVRIFDGRTGELQRSWAAYDDSLRGGVFVAAGDLNGDGTDEVVTAPASGAAPRVRVFDPLTGSETASFFAESEARTGGFSVATIRDDDPTTADRILTGSRVPSGTPIRSFTRDGQFLGAATIGDDLGLLSGAYVGG